MRWARFSTSERDAAAPHCRAGIWTRRWSGRCWAFLRAPAPCSGGSRQVPGETRQDSVRLALQGSPVVTP